MVYLVAMVAGMSSRFGGQTKSMVVVGPKGETLIEYSINQAISSNGSNKISKIIFIINELTEKLFVDLFGTVYKKIPVQYVRQSYDKSVRLRPWGTADAIGALHKVADQPCVLINGDDIYGEDTFTRGFKLFQQYNDNIIGGLKLADTLPAIGTVNRGVIYLDDTDRTVVKDMREKCNISKSNTELLNCTANVNFMGLTPTTVKLVYEKVTRFKEEHVHDTKIECILTNVLGDMLLDKQIKMKFFDIRTEILGITNVGDDEVLRKKLTKTACFT